MRLVCQVCVCQRAQRHTEAVSGAVQPCGSRCELLTLQTLQTVFLSGINCSAALSARQSSKLSVDILKATVLPQAGVHSSAAPVQKRTATTKKKNWCVLRLRKNKIKTLTQMRSCFCLCIPPSGRAWRGSQKCWFEFWNVPKTTRHPSEPLIRLGVLSRFNSFSFWGQMWHFSDFKGPNIYNPTRHSHIPQAQLESSLSPFWFRCKCWHQSVQGDLVQIRSDLCGLKKKKKILFMMFMKQRLLGAQHISHNMSLTVFIPF